MQLFIKLVKMLIFFEGLSESLASGLRQILVVILGRF